MWHGIDQWFQEFKTFFFFYFFSLQEKKKYVFVVYKQTSRSDSDDKCFVNNVKNGLFHNPLPLNGKRAAPFVSKNLKK